jgi:hypothetical protein
VRQAKLDVSDEVRVLVEQGLTNHSYRVLQPSGGAVNDRTKRLKRTQGITQAVRETALSEA